MQSQEDSKEVEDLVTGYNELIGQLSEDLLRMQAQKGDSMRKKE